AGPVYCGYSRRPSANDSSPAESSLPMTPGSSRATASITTSAAASPPASTKSPTDSSPSQRWSATRWSTPSYRPQRRANPADRASSAATRWSKRLGVLDRGEQGLGCHHHAGAPSERCVVDAAVTVGRPVARVVHPNVEQAPLAGASEERHAERAVEVLGEDAVDVDAHAGHR